ncbi:MAG: hypothetical protein NVSMB6_13420 [Burkholderiaceae bacterium]
MMTPITMSNESGTNTHVQFEFEPMQYETDALSCDDSRRWQDKPAFALKVAHIQSYSCHLDLVLFGARLSSSA